jgi:hypothetical protein
MRASTKMVKKIGGRNLKSASEKFNISTEILKIFEELVREVKDE